jgi:two-component system copper resistance phosphate regulon response regulator CusR
MRILVVEDERKLASTLRRGLEAEGYAVDVVYDGPSAKLRLETSADEYDLVLLDVMLPGMDGTEVSRAARAAGITVPILMLTARSGTDDKIGGLDAGADDYVLKPFSFPELFARIRALLRRPREALPAELTVADLTLDPVTRKVRRAGREITLTAKEYAILEVLMRRPGRVFTQEQIVSRAWDREYDAWSNVVEVHVSNLRKKIDGGHVKKLVHTVRGAGYVLKV